MNSTTFVSLLSITASTLVFNLSSTTAQAITTESMPFSTEAPIVPATVERSPLFESSSVHQTFAPLTDLQLAGCGREDLQPGKDTPDPEDTESVTS